MILKHGFPHSPFIIDFHFILSFNLSFFFNFQKCIKSGTNTDLGTKTDNLKKSHKMFKTDIYLHYSHTCEF